MNNLSYFLFLSWLCYLIVSSILLFTRGFLLSRSSLTNISSCLSHSKIPCSFEDLFNSNSDERQCSSNEDLSTVLNDLDSAPGGCLPPKAKVILIIIDALRYDFTLYDENNKNPLPYQNKLPVIQKILNEHLSSSRLYKFIADPPTTTMQRLKALTTGSLPTFIDAGSNFATSEINEDNIIDQMIKNSYDIVFMGDDTWNSLYPNRFIRNYPYPSFDVWDLDSVDNGVKQHLFAELNKTDWNLLVGHFLGVDHCGHRYGPNHPEMSRKLTEMNSVIGEIIQQMSDNMMLFVIGDHGMTITGDHGGESTDEVTAGLFVYSKRELLNLGLNPESVKQVDLVPTLSTILGIPIPFQNLGVIIPNCLPRFNYSLESFQISLYSIWSNVEQMFEYIEEYSKTDKIFKGKELEESIRTYLLLKGKLSHVTDHVVFLEFYKQATTFLESLREMCEGVWVQFEPFLMTRGLLFLFLSIFFIFLIADGIPSDRLPEIFQSSFLLCSYVVLLISVVIGTVLYYLKLGDNLLPNIFFATGLVSQFMLVMLIIQNWQMISLNWYSKSKKERIPNIICRLVLVFNLSTLFSNSYIIEESFVLLFLLVTVILVGTFSVISPNISMESKKKNWQAGLLKGPKLKFVFLAVLIIILIRGSMYFWTCREEQQWCFESPHDVGTITKAETTKLQWGVTVVILTMLVFSTKGWLRDCGNLNGYGVTVMFFKFFPSAIVVCISGYWAMKNMSTGTKPVYSVKSINSLVWVTYAMIVFGIASCIVKPLCIFIMPSRNTFQEEQNIVPSLFNRIKSSLKNNKQNEDVPVVCGLATVYSSVFLMIAMYMTLLFALLLGDSVAPACVIMFTTAFFVVLVMSVVRIEKATHINQLFDVPNASVLVWIILAQYFFYATGHQPTFPNIAWEAAFIGTSGVFTSNVISATLIILNTFCSYVVMGMLLPLVLIMPFTIFVMIPSVVGKKTELKVAAERGEVVLFEKDKLMMTSMFTLASKYIMGQGMRVFASMLAATIHCRHLMVWKIFAPKLIFESVSMLVTLVSVMSSFLILIRVNSKVEQLVVALNKRN